MSQQPAAAPPPPPMMMPAPAATPPALPRWGVQTSFFQRRQPAFWLFVVLLVFTGLTILTEQLLYLQVFPAGWIFSIVLLSLYVVPVAIAIYVLDIFEREPISLIVAAFLWGGVVAAGIAVTANSSLLEALGKLAGPNFAQTWGVALVAPPVEESLKFLGVVMIFLIARSEIDDIFDGFVYGAIIGLGFAAIEDVQYFVQAVANSGGSDQIGPVFGLFLVRVVLAGAYMHVLWTGITGLGFAYYITQRDQPLQKRRQVLIGLFAAAVSAHIIWNSPLLTELLTGLGGMFVFGLIKGLPFLIFLILLVRFAQQREQRWFRVLTASEAGTDILTEQDLADLGGLRSRWSARRRVAARKGPQSGKLAGQIQREQIALAMIRSRSESDDDSNVEAQRERIRALRTQLNALPDIAQPIAAQPGMAQAAAPAAPGPAGWTPTHVVPAAGMAAWSAPDPSQPPLVTLAAGVQLSILEERGAWAHVMGSNGWTGWVDSRLLAPIA